MMFSISFKLLILAIFVNAVSGFDLGNKFMLEKIQEWQGFMEKQPVKNTQCAMQVNEWKTLIGNSEILQDNWAWRMVDATNKVNPGILTGNVIGTGNMDECLAINAMENNVHIKGKYCYGGITIPFSSGPVQKNSLMPVLDRLTNRQEMLPPAQAYLAALCIPHQCTMSDLMPVLPEQAALALEGLCQTADTLREWDDGDWGFILFLIIIATLVICSTTYDVYLRHTEAKLIHPITLAFSFCTNGEKLLKISHNPEQMQCLNGMRALSMLWVMGGHRFSVSTSSPMVNMEQALEWTKDKYSQYIQGAPVAVDSFFFLTGVLISYGFMKTQSKPKARFNIVLFYIHRYLRLTPAVAVLYFFHVTFLRHITTGPLWPLISTAERENCLENALSYFLYIQNYINPELQCLAHTWYLSVDMQLFIISPLILIPLVKIPKRFGYGLMGLLISLSILPPILITYFYDILEFDQNYMKKYYVQPHTRIGPWLVGILLGYIFYQLRDRKIKIHWITNLVAWALVFTGMISILYVGNDMARSEDVLSHAFYNGFHRLFWAVGLMWIVFACQKGYGGFVNWFLSLPLFQVMARLSYSMYLLHMVIQIITIFRKRTPLYFDDYEMLNQSFGDIITVTFVAFFYCMIFESPVVVIEKVIFAPNGYVMIGMNWCMAIMGFGSKAKDENSPKIKQKQNWDPPIFNVNV